MKYLGIRPQDLRVAVFDFTGCEGCELQLANREETLVDFLRAARLVRFREIADEAADEYDVALVEGAISRADEIDRLQRIRERARLLVALGTCACYGGVNKLKNAFDFAEANAAVYGAQAKETLPARAVSDVVSVDLAIPGCPVSKEEVERILQHLLWDVPWRFPSYPVCLECKQRFTVCTFQKGELCLGPITMGGCGAPCPAGGLGCLGCRGPAADPNVDEFRSIARERGFGDRDVAAKLEFFGSFDPIAAR
ncbi:MAG: NADH:ubiquinone oxidoreductase [Planctomycetota bacterium]